jgi:hypothetical protein
MEEAPGKEFESKLARTTYFRAYNVWNETIPREKKWGYVQASIGNKLKLKVSIYILYSSSLKPTQQWSRLWTWKLKFGICWLWLRERERERAITKQWNFHLVSHFDESFIRASIFEGLHHTEGFRTLMIIIGLNFELWHKGVVEPLDGGWWVVLNRCKDSLIKFEMMIWWCVSNSIKLTTLYHM